MTDEVDDLKRKLRRLRQKNAKDARKAWADGFLTGVCGQLQPGDLAIDCGANVGEISARLLATGADVVAFDPDPLAFEQLRQRFADQQRYQLHNAAVGCTEAEVVLMRAANFDGNEGNASQKSTVITGARNIGEAGERVTVRQIDFVAFLRDLIAARGPVAFLKIDIEGAELDLLDALDRAGLLAHIRCTVAETHEHKFPDLRLRYEALRTALSARYAPHHVNLDWI